MDHHAYLVQGGQGPAIWEFLDLEHNFKRQANPDALGLEVETFGIDEARNLSDWAYKKSFGPEKFAVIQTNSITSEAQNALLKLFEEPPADTYFFLIVSNVGVILPTLLSRIHIWSNGKEKEGGEIKKEDPGFLKASVAERMKIVGKIVKDKNKEEAKELVRSTLNILKNEPVKYQKEIEELMKSERYLSSRAPSIKMILEHIAISI